MDSNRTLLRLVDALDEIGRREDGALAGGDGEAFLELEKRAEPIALRVASLAGAPLDPGLLERGLAILSARRLRRAILMRLLETTRDEIRSLDEIRSRARSLRPAYAPRHAESGHSPAFAASA